VLLLYPEGRVLTRRWRPVLWLTVSAGLLAVSWNALKPGPIFDETMPIENPAGIAWLESNLGFVDTAVFFCFGTGILLCASSAMVRYRRSRGSERDRMKWLALATILLAVGFVAAIVLVAIGFQRLGESFVGLGFAAVPIAVGIGVLRYRLYEIDRVISRTVSFALVTAALGGAYVGLVLLGQSLFSSVAGGGGLVIAVSTLAVAALFLPVRSWVQRFVDRRFNRHRYDAQKTLEAFGARLREQVDLGTLSGDLRTAVDETMQPAHVSVWLRERQA
jgi:MFS family permease